nr:hypothetical protein [Lachnospiraceae bacterium]
MSFFTLSLSPLDSPKIEQMFAKVLGGSKHMFYYSLAAVPEAPVYPKGEAVTMPVIGREKTNR